MSETAKPSDAYRLPTDVRPKHYDITVRTDLVKETFEGVVKIDLEVVRPTASIVLNAAANLVLTPASLSTPTVTQLAPIETSYDESTQRISYTFPQELPKDNKITLRIGFAAPLTGSMSGYYKSAWDKGIYSLTQFEPTKARRALPCWDEPLLKATFDVTLISRAGLVSLSNMPALATPAAPQAGDEALYAGVEAKEWVATKFETTPPMSTYLLAYANGPFAHLESSYKSPLSGKVRPLRIYTTPDLIHQGQFALDVKAKALPLYEQVFDVEFPLPKLDTLVASDFDSGAMENWGLITGRTNAYLLDPNNPDMRAKKQIAGGQSHEVAHMWFGNITTMAWWDNLYLKEGFATVMGQSIILDKIFPEWKVDSEFINNILDEALALDAKPSSHPIEVECPDANNVNQIFDALSYAKAASVLRMLSKYVGEDKFLQGASIYLKKHLYANSVSRDLWEAIGEATGIDIPNLMDNWVSKIGFPVLTVTDTETGIRVRQDRFFEDGPAKPEDNQTIWTVPLGLLTTSQPGQAIVNNEAVLSEREAEFRLDTSKPFKLNADTNGVFRVLYSPERLAAIATEAAKSDTLFTLNDRMGLINDAMALSKAGLLKVSAALNLVYNLREEKEFLVWSGISSNLGIVLSTWWENDHIVELLNSFRKQLFAPIVNKLGYQYSKAETADITQLRTLSITQAARGGDPVVVKELQDRFAKYIAGDKSAIPADLLTVTFHTAAVHGGAEGYEAIVKIYDHPDTPSVKTAAIRALGATPDSELMEKTFSMIRTRSRNQDVMYFFYGLNQNFKARKPLRAFFEKHYDEFVTRFEATFTLKRLVKGTYAGFSAEKDREQTEAFFKGKDTSRYDQGLAQALDGIKAKTAWIERSTSDAQEWLENWEKTSTKL
ncbi:leucyl aminopeptidase [Artomyces pyxidatus]|uniref:Leucyl aminopeptidase n=1 Tax=Artomyces pyxidatus TaxID=48021 RepID=A0ACB8T805_9AGAM|nr:leucyl aminopeptidase [Artomyces pyxidatus]